MTIIKNKVMLGMSGGVDSSASAIILLEKGYDVTGVTLKLKDDEYFSNKSSFFPNDIEDAAKVAQKLGIKHIVRDLRDTFSKTVVNYFVSEYKKGRTPNPCIVCNKNIKFGAMLDYALSMGFDFIATGHYANTLYDEKTKRWLILKSSSLKDQSYVLYGMSQFQISHTLFPLSNMDKSEVRNIAEKHGLSTSSKPDSQEICFINGTDHASFIDEYSGSTCPPGNFIDHLGNILGKHSGITHYTLGQRRGLGIALGKHMYVTNINPITNNITLSDNKGRYMESLIAEQTNFIPFEKLNSSLHVKVKIRYQASPVPAIISPLHNDRVLVNFEEPQKIAAPGQSVVFYQNNILTGGGIINSQS